MHIIGDENIRTTGSFSPMARYIALIAADAFCWSTKHTPRPIANHSEMVDCKSCSCAGVSLVINPVPAFQVLECSHIPALDQSPKCRG